MRERESTRDSEQQRGKARKKRKREREREREDIERYYKTKKQSSERINFCPLGKHAIGNF